MPAPLHTRWCTSAWDSNLHVPLAHHFSHFLSLFFDSLHSLVLYRIATIMTMLKPVIARQQAPLPNICCPREHAISMLCAATDPRECVAVVHQHTVIIALYMRL